MKNSFDLIVLGAGSGGLAAAKRAASYGAKVAIVEGDRVGGTCVIRGCVPKKLLVYGSLYGEYIKNANSFGVEFTDARIDSRVLLTNVRKEVDRLNKFHIEFLARSGVELIKGWAEFTGPNSILVKDTHEEANFRELQSSRILIAVGGRPNRPDIKGASLGWVSDDMFLQERFPEKIVIVGAGFIACEFACILNGLGSKVIQIVRGSRLLRGFDSDLAEVLKKDMQLKGIDLYFDQEPIAIDRNKGGIGITTSAGQFVDCGGVLFAIGRTPDIQRLRLNVAGVKSSKQKIEVDMNHMTNISNIFAIGDVTSRVNLTPVAIDEGRTFADSVFGNKKRSVNYELIPQAVFSQPEIGTVGLDEDNAIEKFGENGIKIYSSRFRPMSKSLSKRGENCFLKLIIETRSQKIVGCHMVGEHASEIIQMAAIALGMGATKADFDRTMALHPTISEEFVTMT